jgi:protein phosphatase 1 regulatory subunit 7
MILIVELHFIFQELILRDNKLTRIPDASIFKGLLVFDVSFNEISSLRGLSNVSSILKELYVSKNEVTKMEELDHFRALEILELGSNRLRVRI